jgi:hypothetical protein
LLLNEAQRHLAAEGLNIAAGTIVDRRIIIALVDEACRLGA